MFVLLVPPAICHVFPTSGSAELLLGIDKSRMTERALVAGVTPRRNHRLALLVARIVCWPNKQLTAALGNFF